MIESLYPFARKWSEKGSVLLYSDPHFGDSDCKLMSPDWPEPEEQVENLKKCCTKNDTLVILGDIGDPKYLQDIKSYKVLIAGNHDLGLSNYEKYFDEMYAGPLFISDRIVLSHEPLIYMPYIFNIYGHDHSSWTQNENGLNVCSNVIGYKPLNLGKLIKKGLVSDVPTIHRYTIDKIE